jgi:16S rRNA (guanine1516-N2)-methyltransferase
MALQLGFQVSGNERSALIYFLLHQALQNSKLDYLKDVCLIHEDAKKILLKKEYPADLDVFYFDPMYPHKKGSALPRKEMQIFRSLVGTDDDAEEVLELALASPVSRVVLKRPTSSPKLMNPTYSVETKILRFDIYQRS